MRSPCWMWRVRCCTWKLRWTRHFRAPAAGKVIQSRAGYAAFVPAPLPPALAYSSELVLRLSRADAALSELSGLGRHLPNPHLLIAPYVRREAVQIGRASCRER